jgi:hypothetical protein
MSIFPPATADLVDRLSRYRDRLIAGGRTSAAAVVDAAIAEVRTEATAQDRHRELHAEERR